LLLQSRYLDNHWANTKFCGIQFRGNHVESTRAEEKVFKDKFAKAKCYDDVDDVAGDWAQGKADFEEICRIIESRPQRTRRPTPTTPTTAEDLTSALDASDAAELSEESQVQMATPKEWRPNPHLDEVLKTPKIPLNPARIPIPAAVSGRDELTPTPSPLIT
jgi:tRNA-dihydrouridine synthase 2